MGPGKAFGDMSLLVEGPRSADVAADEPVVAARLALADLRALEVRRPEVLATIYRNLARTLGGRLRRGERAGPRARRLIASPAAGGGRVRRLP